MSESKNKAEVEVDLNEIIESQKQLALYKETYASIKESILIKSFINVFMSVFKVLFYLVSLIFIFFLIRGAFLTEQQLNEMNYLEKGNLLWLYFAMAVLFFIIARIIRSTIQKRNSIYSLTKLLDEIFGYMEKELDEEKVRYEKQKKQDQIQR